MAKKVNDVKDGDLKSNVVVLRSVYGKVGQKYFIQPQRDPKTGRFPECVKQVNSYGDIILTEDERNREAQGLVHFVPVTEVFTITDGKSFNLDDILYLYRDTVERKIAIKTSTGNVFLVNKRSIVKISVQIIL